MKCLLARRNCVAYTKECTESPGTGSTLLFKSKASMWHYLKVCHWHTLRLSNLAMIESTTFALSSIRTSLARSSAVHPTCPAAGGCLKGQHAQVEASMVRRQISSHGRWQAAWRTAVDTSLLSPVPALAVWRVLVGRSHSAFVTTDASSAAHTGWDRRGFEMWQQSPVLTYVSTYLAWLSQSSALLPDPPPWRPWHHATRLGTVFETALHAG